MHGQKETVVIHRILVKDTIDENVKKALERKNKTQAILIDAVKENLKWVEVIWITYLKTYGGKKWI